MLKKGEGVSHPIGHVETPKTPLGACAMTTKFLDKIKFALSKFYCRGVSHEKQRFWTTFLSAPKAPPQKRKFDFYCRLAVSDP